MTTSHDSSGDPCPEYVGLLARAADAGLDSGDRDRLDAHVASCPACAEALAAQRAVHDLVATAYEVGPSLGLATRVLAHLEPAGGLFDHVDFRGWTWRVSPVAAGLVLAAWTLVLGGTATVTDAVGSVSSEDAGQTDAVLLADTVELVDLVSLTWEAEVAPATGEELGQ